MKPHRKPWRAYLWQIGASALIWLGRRMLLRGARICKCNSCNAVVNAHRIHQILVESGYLERAQQETHAN